MHTTPAEPVRALWTAAPAVATARILIVDDQEQNVTVLGRILKRAGYLKVESTSDPRRAIELCESRTPDLVLLDLHMPELDGFAVLEQLRRVAAADSYLPVLMLTGDGSAEVKLRALAAGATDFLAKPFDATEVILRIRNLLETRHLYRLLRVQNTHLEARVRERTEALESSQLEILERLAEAGEYRDDDTGRHTQRVGELSAALAAAMNLPAATVEVIRRTAPLHDIGKIGIPDIILLKPSPLTASERAVMETHAEIGAKILTGGRSELIRAAEEIARHHHERWDGTGYPGGLRGNAIPVAARIVAIADVFDALTHDRPYRSAWPVAAAMAEIVAHRGTQFDPDFVDAFVGLSSEARGSAS